jgi:hypothetical protein
MDIPDQLLPHEERPLNFDAALTPTEPIPPAQPSTLHKIFIGKDGLRAGWSLLIFTALCAAIIFCVSAIGHKLHLAAPKAAKTVSEISATRLFSAESIYFLVVLLATWITSKIERRHISVYGLGGRRKVPNFFAGLA